MTHKRYHMCENASEKYELDLPFIGICSFCKYPICNDLDDIDADVAIIGACYDASTQWRSGCKMGPRGLRDASTLYNFGAGGAYDHERDVMYLTPDMKIVDCGDVEMVHGDSQQCLENIEAAVKKIVSKGAIPVVLGGDHAVTIPTGYGLEEKGPFNIVHIDAHLDWAMNKSGQRWGQGSPIRRLSEMDHVDKIWQIGIRGVGSSKKSDFDDARAYGSQIISPREFRKMGVQGFVDQLPENEKFYITFDIDGMDISIAPGTGTPGAGGMLYDEIDELLEGVAKKGEIVGFDLVEVAPCYDINQATSLLGAKLVLNFIAYILHEKKKKGQLKSQQK